MKNSKVYLLLMSFYLLTACQTFRKAEPLEAVTSATIVGQWEAKAMIKSRETGDASIVSLDVLAQKPNPMRVEVTTSLGVALASILIKESEVEYIVPKQKRYYSGPLSETALLPVLKIKVDPKILTAALFETSYPDWQCKATEGIIEDCSTPDGVQLKWEREAQNKKRVSITSPLYDVQIQVKKYESKPVFPQNALVLKVPDSYKKYKLK